jgi:hypothetical protein
MSIETPSKVGIISKALVLCGEPPLGALSDDRYGATAGGALFELLYEGELQSHPWRFSMKKAALSRLAVTPLNQYQYAHQIPSDCLLARHVYPVTDYDIYGDRIYSNNLSIDLDYQFKPEVARIPAYFSLLMTYALYRDMAKPVTESDGAVRKAEVAYSRQRDIAMYADAQARPAVTVQYNPFIAARQGG